MNADNKVCPACGASNRVVSVENVHYEDWRYDVANGDTKLGLADWIEHNLEQLEGVTLDDLF